MNINTATPYFSIVVPVFNEKQSVSTLYDEIVRAMEEQAWSFEILFADDGSTDGTKEVLAGLVKKDSRVRVFSFKKNFGKSTMLACGFQNASGTYVATLDADLQDDPKEIVHLYRALKDRGADMVSGWKRVRLDPWTKTVPSKIFNAVTSWITGIRIHDFNCGLKLYRKEVVKNIPMYGELHRFIPAIASWKGFGVIEEAVRHRPRKYGKSKYGMERLLAGVIDLHNVMFLTHYEAKPSHLFGATGLVFALIGAAISGHLVFVKLTGGIIAPRYPYMMFGLAALIVGIQFIFFGHLSEMMVHFFRRLPGNSSSPYCEQHKNEQV